MSGPEQKNRTLEFEKGSATVVAGDTATDAVVLKGPAFSSPTTIRYAVVDTGEVPTTLSNERYQTIIKEDPVEAGSGQFTFPTDENSVSFSVTSDDDLKAGTIGRVTVELLGSDEKEVIVKESRDIFAAVFTAREADVRTSGDLASFQQVRTGETATDTVFVTNDDEATRESEITGLEVIGEDKEDFSVTEPRGAFTLEPGEREQVLVEYAPRQTSSDTSRATLRYEASNVPTDSIKTFPISGTRFQVERVIADYRDDFQAESPATGWHYLWNQPDTYKLFDFSGSGHTNSEGFEVEGTKIAHPDSDVDRSDGNPDNNYIPNEYDNDNVIGDTAHYTALEWFPGNRDFYTAVGQWPFDGRLQAAANLRFEAELVRPGASAGEGPTDAYNSEDGDGDPYGNEIDRYAIAAYTVQPEEEGTLEIRDSMVELTNASNSDGIVVRVFVENTEIGNPKTISGSGDFDRDLGSVEAGQTVYVAFGPNADSAADNFLLDYTIKRVAE